MRVQIIRLKLAPPLAAVLVAGRTNLRQNSTLSLACAAASPASGTEDRKESTKSRQLRDVSS